MTHFVQSKSVKTVFMTQGITFNSWVPLPLVALSHLTFPYDRSLHNVSVFPPNGIVGRTGTTKASHGQKLGILHPSSSLGLGFGFGRPCCRLSRQELLPGIANTTLTKGSHPRKKHISFGHCPNLFWHFFYSDFAPKSMYINIIMSLWGPISPSQTS